MEPLAPTLKQLRYLTTLYETQHFGKAADLCHVTQSTLSSGIKELETLLDHVLIERSKRMVRFTPLGEQVTQKAYEILKHADELIELVSAAGTPLSSGLRMGVIPTIAPFYLPHVLPKLRTAYPQLKLFLKEDKSDVVCDALAHGQLDVVLLALPFACGDVETAHLFNDPFFAAFHPDEQADLCGNNANSNAAIDPVQLLKKQLLLLEDGHCLKDHALAACGQPQLRMDANLLGTSLHTLVQMVDNKLGVTLLPQIAIDGGIIDGTHLMTRPLAGPAPYREIGLVWRRNSPRAQEYQLLAQFLRDQHHNS